jgi:hypothetical protein
MSSIKCHRLTGLEPDNLLAFLTLLGLLQALESADGDRPEGNRLLPRADWSKDLPLRPTLSLAFPATPGEVAESAARGIERVAAAHVFGDRKDLDFSKNECREVLQSEARAADLTARQRIDLLAALMSDAAIKDDKKEHIDPTPLCLLFRQGHQHFLDRLASLPKEPAPPPRGRGKNVTRLSASECLAEALFSPWHRQDPTFSFRWDPEEDVRYALMAGDPTDSAYKPGTQHGANRLAAIGLAALTLAPAVRAGRVRPIVIGGEFGREGFSFAWPIWRGSATLSAIRVMLAHPDLRELGALRHLGVEDVLVARRISVGKFINFTRARPLPRAKATL